MSDQAKVAVAADAPKSAAAQKSFSDSLKRAAQSGMAGASAMAINVTTLMWMRTTVNYQYANGGSMVEAFKALYKQGGILRFYRGYLPALLQGPMSRFGDTASNAGMLHLLDSNDTLRGLPIGVKSAFASTGAALFRVLLMPIDTVKTSMQVNGGLSTLVDKFKTGGPRVFFHGAMASASATFVGHYPWFGVYNYLNATLAKPAQDDLMGKLLRSAGIGFCATLVSDTCSNSIRVVKTCKQSSKEVISYQEAVKQVLAKDGVKGLFFRGLETKILSNGVQGMMFSVLWKFIDDKFISKKEDGAASKQSKKD